MPGKYHMRKAEREILDRDELIGILKRGKFMTLALCSDNDPYAVTLSYGLDGSSMKLYFHSSFLGAKMDLLKRNGRVCGTVIEDLGYRSGECSHRYRSVVVFGTMKQINNLGEKKRGMMTMFSHLEEDPDRMRERFLSRDADYSGINVLELVIDRLTGKESS